MVVSSVKEKLRLTYYRRKSTQLSVSQRNQSIEKMMSLYRGVECMHAKIDEDGGK